MSVKIIIIEDHALVRQGIRSLLESEPGIEIIAEARNGREALELCARNQPDVVLMDLNVPVMSGLECAHALKKNFPQIKVIVLTMHDDESYLIDMLEAGANGYLWKNSSKEELIFAIKQVAKGGRYIAPEFTISMLNKYTSRIGPFDNFQSGIELSEGERQILSLIAEGFTNTEMANKLFISVRTVESRRKKLLEKTGTTNTATLIKFAIRRGLIK